VSSWFSNNIVQMGRLPLFCFFCAFVAGFGFIRLSVRLIRAQVRWWPGNVTPGDLHVHHMVFGVVFMLIGGVTGIAPLGGSLAWRSGAAALFGLGAALVLDEFALILHLRDVYWTSAGRLSVDAVFVAAGVTVLLLLGIVPSLVPTGQHGDSWEAITSLTISVLVTYSLAAITLLKGKIWTGLFGLFLFPLLIVGAIRLARPGSPWARWRYQRRPRKRARAARRERQVRQPVIRFKSRVEDFLSGLHDRPDHPPDSAPGKRKAAAGHHSDAKQRDPAGPAR
jgi:hypothetical protein